MKIQLPEIELADALKLSPVVVGVLGANIIFKLNISVVILAGILALLIGLLSYVMIREQLPTCYHCRYVLLEKAHRLRWRTYERRNGLICDECLRDSKNKILDSFRYSTGVRIDNKEYNTIAGRSR